MATHLGRVCLPLEPRHGLAQPDEGEHDVGHVAVAFVFVWICTIVAIRLGGFGGVGV